MDMRRFDTADLLGMDILSKPLPVTRIPKDREKKDFSVDEIDRENICRFLGQGYVVHCIEYYGIPQIWKDGEAYHGVLLQYRSVTEDHTWKTAEEAIDWFVETAFMVAE